MAADPNALDPGSPDGVGTADTAAPASVATADTAAPAGVATTMATVAPVPADGLADTISPDNIGVARTLAGAPSGRVDPSSVDLGKRYQIGAELGRGGMGRVVRAVDAQLGREVAMKELHAGPHGVDAAALLRFLREARVTGQLEHPNIVPVHELARHPDGTFFYTMKRIRGRSLAAALREAPGMAGRLKLLRHFRDVCEAVAYAHSRGVVHRDLKPDNVMVGEFGETLVVDWGIAKVQGAADPRSGEIRERLAAIEDDTMETIAGYAIGTPAYMSPEQARGDIDAIDERSDVWSLGAILYEMLTGRPPYVGRTVVDVLHAVMHADPVPVRTMEPAASPDLSAIAERALRRDRSVRYASAKAIADDIGAWQDGGRVGAYEYSAFELVRLFVRRNRAASIAAAVIAIALVVGATLVGLSYRAELRARETAETRALLSEAGRLDQLGHRAHAFALLRAADALDRTIVSDLARAGLRGHAEEAQPLVLAGHTGPMTLARFSPDGTRVVTAAADGTIKEWDAGTAAPIRTLTLPLGPQGARGHAYAMNYTADGSRLAAAGNFGLVTIWNLRTGEIENRFPHESVVEAIELSPDGSMLATGSRDGKVRAFKLDGREPRVLVELQGWVQSIAFSPEGMRIVAAVRDGSATIVGIDGATIRTLDGVALRAVTWMPDGRRVAGVSRQGGLAVWDAESGAITTSFQAHSGPTTWVAVSHDGATLASAGEDGQARLWNVESKTLVLDLAHSRRVGSVELDASGRRVLTTEFEGHHAAIWDVPERSSLVLRGHTAWVHSARFSPDGSMVASASRDGTVRQWLAATGAAVRVLSGHQGSCYAVAVSPDGHRLASVGRDGTAILWDAASGAEDRRIAAHTDAIYDVAFVDNERIVTAGLDRRVRVWRVSDGAQLAEYRGGPDEAFFSISVAPNGRIAAGAQNGHVILWPTPALGSGEVLASHEAEVNTTAFSPDGAVLASGGRDGRLLLWDAASGRLVRELAHVERSFVDLAFSPDGRRIVGAVEAEVVRAWDVATGEILATYEGHGAQVRSVSVSPDGDTLVTASADTTLRLARVHGSPSGNAGNLRVCRGEGFTIVPVVLGQDIDPIWADAATCAPSR